MAETWYALCESATGRLESVGTVVADDSLLASKGLVKISLGTSPPPDTKMWDQATRTFVDRPPKVIRDLFMEMLAETELRNLSQAVKDRIVTAANRHFGQFRYQ